MRSKELATLGSTLVILRIVFGAEDRLIGYSFIGVGALLAIVSSFKPRRQSRTHGPRALGVKNG